ncbi:hypothetical protein [Microbaculum marinum]|uniref:Uncharacterized protein n=1 Tax=Microbaculum marinum TaxID=1764581 RepID=A0AAW9RNR0_9HYPH
MKARKSARRALLAAIACLLCFGMAAPKESVSAEQLLVRVAFDQDTALDGAIAQLADIAKPAPLTFVAERRTGLLIRTSRNGYERLLADPDLRTVRLVRGNVPARQQETPHEFVTYEIRLNASETGAEAVAASELAATPYTASVVGRRTGAAVAPPAREAGPGMLLVRALDTAGEELYRTVVPDPRLVRYEAVDEDGRFTGRTDFYRTEATVRADIPADPAIAALRITAPSKGAAAGVAEVNLQ